MLVAAGCTGGGTGTTTETTNLTTTAATTLDTTASTSATTPTKATSGATPTETTSTSEASAETSVATTTTQKTTVAFSERTEFHGTVTEVVDGDSVKVRFESGQTETIRLLGVDTPEVHVENTPDEFEGIAETQRGRQHLGTWGEKASSYATQVLADEQVRVVVDEQADRRGSYGRLLAYVYVDGKHFNKQLLSNGYARVYDSSFSKRSGFDATEQTARSTDRGLWNFEKQTTTASSGPGSISVARVVEDASGNDHENENGEYIVLKNTGGSSVDLGDWTVRDEATHVYQFPSGASLGAGETLTLYTGSGSSGGGSYYWGSDAAVWNNNGDTVIVKDDSGSTVEQYGY